MHNYQPDMEDRGMKGIIFCKRTVKEILRDPLSYIFCLAFPIVMLVIMSVVNESIPKQANMTVFQIQNLAPGIAYFGLTFIMLFICIQVSKDRSTALIMRLHASPMKSKDFILGYTLSVIILAVLQLLITFAASFVTAAVVGTKLPVTGVLLSLICLLPSAIMFISVGMIFGTLIGEKAAPGICSIIITVVGMVGGVWMDVDNMKGVILSVSRVFPFYHGVKLARLALAGEYAEMGQPLLVVCAWMLGLYLLAIAVMNGKLKKDTY